MNIWISPEGISIDISEGEECEPMKVGEHILIDAGDLHCVPGIVYYHSEARMHPYHVRYIGSDGKDTGVALMESEIGPWDGSMPAALLTWKEEHAHLFARGDTMLEWARPGSDPGKEYGVTLSVARMDIGVAELDFICPSREAAHDLWLALREVQDIHEYL